MPQGQSIHELPFKDHSERLSCIQQRWAPLTQPRYSGVQVDRSLLEMTARDMHDMHTLNYVASPSQRVTDYFMNENLAAHVAVPGAGAFESFAVNFWDLINQFISAFLSSSTIPLDDIHGPDYTVNHMSLNKRAVAFV